VLDNYFKVINILKHHPKYKDEAKAEEFERIGQSFMRDHPALFNKVFSGNRVLFQEAKREIDESFNPLKEKNPTLYYKIFSKNRILIEEAEQEIDSWVKESEQEYQKLPEDKKREVDLILQQLKEQDTTTI
jgi:hypothetical protein